MAETNRTPDQPADARSEPEAEGADSGWRRIDDDPSRAAAAVPATSGAVDTTASLPETRVLPAAPDRVAEHLDQPAAVAQPAAPPAPAPPVAPAAPTAPPAPAASVVPGPPPVPAPPVEQPVVPPAAEGPVAPKRRSNRLVGTAWVLLAAGLFEAVYLLLVVLFVLVVEGAQVVPTQTALIMQSPFGWLPVIFFFLLFELTVLLLNRAGRFTYVVASLIVGLVVYVGSVLLISLIVRNTLGDISSLVQLFLLPWSIFIGVVAREVMLWTGFAIGARGKRLRRRDRADREAYARQVAERSDAGAAA